MAGREPHHGSPVRYPPQLLDDIRQRLPVSTVVGRKVRLKKAGREWKGLSPFGAEKTPSFFVNDQKGFYHDFSSGKHGDVFTFLMETEGVSFPEAVERLAAEAGVPLPATAPEGRAEANERRGLAEAMELAASFFEEQLRGAAGRKARDYLTRRGLGPEACRRFRLGYAPGERFSLRDHLAGRGVPADVMALAGLVVAGEDVAVPYDRFRDRVMFPIGDARGRVIAFGGRALAADVPAKYLNSPETPLFHKGRVLYNYDRARGPAHERGTVIAVEGYVDVIAMSEAGFPHTVAPLGTALTEEQMALLWRLAEEPVLCFDGDKAGRRAAYRALDVALPAIGSGRSLRFALLPEGQDPDDLARAGGAAAIEGVLRQASPLVETLWARETEAVPLDTPERRAGLAARLRAAVATIRDETVRAYYRDEMEARLQALSPARPARAGSGRTGRFSRQERASARVALRASPMLARTALFVGGAAESPREAFILAVLARHPDLLDAHADALAELGFAGPQAKRLGSALLDGLAAGEPLDLTVLEARLERAGLAETLATLTARVRPGDRWALDQNADPLRLSDALRQAMTLQRRAFTLNSELRAAERALAEDESEANLAWLRDVQSQLSSIEGAEADLNDS